jgi:UDP-galactopyranose mutase
MKVSIIGAGISGLCAYKQLAKFRPIIFEKEMVGGLCVPNEKYFEQSIRENGYAFGKFGEHIFHTDNKEVYEAFRLIYPECLFYEHKTEIYVNGEFLPYPPNIKTLGKASVEQIVIPYTEKQWGEQKEEDIDFILKRFKTFNDYDYRTFKERFQFIPNKMDYGSPDINTKDVVYREISFDDVDGLDADLVINTSPLDRFYGKDFLIYRSLDFEIGIDYGNTFKDRAMTINYPESIFKYTRVHHHGRFLVYEFPRETGTPMYPVFNPERSLKIILDNFPFLECIKVNDTRFFIHKYKNKLIVHVGRLGSYQYLNIDKAIENVLGALKEIVNE